MDKDELSDRWGMKQAILRPFSDHPSKATMKSEESKVDQSGMGLVAWTITPDIIDIERVARTEPVYITNRAGDLVEERVRLTLALEIRDEVAEVIVPLHGRYLAPGKELGLGRWWGRRNEKEVVVFGEGGGEIRGSWQCALSEDPERSELYILTTSILLFSIPIEKILGRSSYSTRLSSIADPIKYSLFPLHSLNHPPPLPPPTLTQRM